MSLTTAVLLAGGFGTRLKTLFPETAKPLVPIAEKPFIQHLVSAFQELGIQHLVLCLGYKSESFKASIEGFKKSGLQVSISEEKTPLGTGGAIRNAKKFLPEKTPFLIANADTYFHGDLKSFFSFQPDDLGALGLFQVPDISRFGSVEIQGNKVVAFKEKTGQGPGYVNSGLVILNPKALNQFPEISSFSLEKDFLQLQAHRLNAITLQGKFFDIGLPSSYAEFNTIKVFEILNSEQKKQLKSVLIRLKNDSDDDDSTVLKKYDLFQSLNWIQPSFEHLSLEFIEDL